MRLLKTVGLAAAMALGLAGCGGSADNGVSARANDIGAVVVPVAKARAGKIYRQEITAAATGDLVVMSVFEPTQIEVGKSYPLVLNGPGYGSGRDTTAPDGSFIKRLQDAGYYVITIDPRGFGESGGSGRGMDPEYEGQNYIAVLDWAEKLEGLRRHGDGRMVVGSYGGSYGGMFQLLLAGADPKERLRVIAPDITPYDLSSALGLNGVVKSGWGSALIGGGEALGLTDPAATLPAVPGRLAAGWPLRQDPTIHEALISAVLSNAFSTTAVNYLKYHTPVYFCEGKPAGEQTFMLPNAVPDTGFVPPKAYPKIDALITQGMRDSLYRLNEAYSTYQCLKRSGGDVRLIAHQSGHVLPLSLETLGAEEALDAFYAALNPPEWQGPGGSMNCGSVNYEDAVFGWFEEKLKGRTGAADKAISSGRDVCISIADGDAIHMPDVKKGGERFAINSSTPQLNSLLGVVGSLFGGMVREQLQSVQPLYTAPADDVVVAGIPTASVKVSALDPALEMPTCPTPFMMGSCDPIFFLGIGRQAAGKSDWKLVDGQIMPLRGFGEHNNLNMNGISVRLKKGDRLALLIYAFHAQYPITWSRDVFVPAATLSGVVDLPILKAGEFGSLSAPADPGAASGGLCAPAEVPGLGGQCLPAP